MKNIFLAVMVCFAVLAGSSLLAQEQKGPRIEVKEMQHNFGKVAQGTQVSYVFQIRNAGNEPLAIERIAAT
jgi:hypothetical protein